MDPSKTPAANPPPGVIPNFEDPESGQKATIAISVILLFCILIVTIGRLYHNIRISRSIGTDDYLAAVSLLASIIFNAFVLQQSYLFRHQWNIPVSWFDDSRAKWSFALSIFLGPATFFPKAAILFLYLRLFTIARRGFQIVVYITLAWCLCLYWSNVFVEIGGCVPRHHGEQFDSPAVFARCASTLPFAITQGTLNVVTDLWLLVLPLPTLSTLRLSTRKKLWVMGIFATAILGVAASLLGLAYRVKIWKTKDTTWTQNILYLAVLLEIDAAIVCSAMPAFASLALHYYKAKKGTLSDSKPSNTSGRLSKALPRGQNKSPFSLTDTSEGTYINLEDGRGEFTKSSHAESSKSSADSGYGSSERRSDPERGIVKSVVGDVSSHREESQRDL